MTHISTNGKTGEVLFSINFLLSVSRDVVSKKYCYIKLTQFHHLSICEAYCILCRKNLNKNQDEIPVN